MQSNLLIIGIKGSEPIIIVHITEVSSIMSIIEEEFAKIFITRTKQKHQYLTVIKSQIYFISLCSI